MSKQLNLFDEKAYIARKRDVVYKSPSPGYECFVKRYCLRAIRNGDQSTKKELVQKAQSTWKSEGYAKDKEKLELFLMLRNGGKAFSRYVNAFVELISNCCIRILSVFTDIAARSIYVVHCFPLCFLWSKFYFPWLGYLYMSCSRIYKRLIQSFKDCLKWSITTLKQ